MSTTAWWRLLLLIAAAAAVAGCGEVGPPQAVPAAVVSYSATPDPAVDAYARPGNVIVVGMDLRVRDPARILRWRRQGAIVLAYVNAVDFPDRSLGPLEERLYGGDFPQGWLYPGDLSNWPGTRLLDLQKGSAVATYRDYTGTWGGYVARFIARDVIGDGRLFDGVFLDVWGDRVWSLGIGGRDSAWDQGVTETSAAIREAVGPAAYLVANNTPSPAAARYLNGRMFEGFDSRGSGWNQLTGGGETPGLLRTMVWRWHAPQLMILWRNDGAPSAETIRMMQEAGQRASRTGHDVVIGSSDHQHGIPAPFGVTPPPAESS